MKLTKLGKKDILYVLLSREIKAEKEMDVKTENVPVNGNSFLS